MPTGLAALDPSQYVRVNVGFNPMLLQANRDHVRIAFSDAQPTLSNTAFHILSGEDVKPFSVTSSDTNLWALAMTDTSSLTVTETQNIKSLVPLTAFGDTRVAELTPIFQYSFEYTVDNTEMTTNTEVNSGTVTNANAMAVLGTSTTTGSTALMFSYAAAKYNAGLGGLLRFTAKFSTPVAGTEQYAGLTDSPGSSEAFKNGYGVGYDGETFGFHRWVNDSLVTIPQSSWDDPLDGNGPSGMTLDHTNLNVFEIRFQFLGAGAIELWVEDDSTGRFVLVHRILYSNLHTTPSTENPNFCAMFWVNNGATTSDIVLSTASVGYFVEGKSELSHTHRPQFSTGVQQITGVGATEVPVLSIRNKSTYQSKDNFTDIQLELIAVSHDVNSNNTLVPVRVIRDAILTGPSYADISASDSVVELDTAATACTGGRDILDLILSGSTDKDRLILNPLKIIIRPGQQVTIAVSSDSNNTIVDASLLWRELF